MNSSSTQMESPGRLTIAPPSKGLHFRLNELWRFRELLFFLTWRDIKVRYKQTFFGAAWALLQPLLLMAIFSLVLGRLAGVPSGGVPYPIFAFTALIPWTLFSQSLQGASNSLVDNANLVSKVYFPRLLLPLSSTLSFLLDFAIALGLLAVMLIFFGADTGAAILWLPVFTIQAVVTALAAGIWLSALNAKFRDVKYAIPFVAQLWLFASPVGYPSSLIPSNWQTIYALNPMAGVVEGFRWALLGSQPPAAVMMLISGAVTLIALAAAIVYFQQVERTLADVI